MKAYLIQPPYSADPSKMDEYFAKKIGLLDSVPGDADIVVLPEYSDVPCALSNLDATAAAHKKYFRPLMDACAAAAKRLNAVVFVNAYDETPTGMRNTTWAIARDGSVAGKYYKRHLPPSELYTLSLDNSYALVGEEPYAIDIDGVRYAFLTCYDFYFYELFPKIAKQNVDVIIGCSLQRSDTHQATEIMCRFLAYNTNAYVLRSSVSLDGSDGICGATMAVAPDGTVLANLYSEVGIAAVDFDPSKKYYKPAGYGNPPAAHHEYIEFGRRPWLYRPAGPAVSPTDEFMPYPRVCAHRGF
nr:carbon-nitrogen hydrolase family protein [Clostridiales bacterium]